MSDKPIPAWRSFPPLYGHLGVQLEALTPGKCTVRLPYREELCNSAGSIHGGIVATLDEALRDPHFLERGLFARKLAMGTCAISALPVPISAQFRDDPEQAKTAPPAG